MFEFSNRFYYQNKAYKKQCEKIFDLIAKRKKYINDYLHKVSMGNYETRCLPNEEDIKYMFNLDFVEKDFWVEYYKLKVEEEQKEDGNFCYILFDKPENSIKQSFLYYPSNYRKLNKMGYLTINFFYYYHNYKEHYTDRGKASIRFFVKENENNMLELEIEKTKEEFDNQYKYFQKLFIDESKKERRKNELSAAIPDKIEKILAKALTDEELDFIQKYYGIAKNYNDKNSIIEEMTSKIFN